MFLYDLLLVELVNSRYRFGFRFPLSISANFLQKYKYWQVLQVQIFINIDKYL